VLTVVHDENEANQHAPAAVGGSMLDELAREGARAMLAAALQAEVAASCIEVALSSHVEARI
jgi:hypothetical protein